MTRIGYIGLDHHHRAPYVQSIAQLPVEVTAVADSDVTPRDVGADALADATFYDDPERLLDEAAVDVVWLTLSNRDTPAVIEAAIERGVDVLTEKPAARTAADLDPIANRVRESDAIVCPAYTWRAHPISEQLRDLRVDGFFDTVRSFDLRFVASQLATRDTDHYLFDATASRGGIVQWLGVHWIDLVPWILDDRIVRVNARLSAASDGVDVEDGATLQLETESGAVGTLTCGYYLREGRYDTSVRIYGEQGRCYWDPMGETFGFDTETAVELDSSSAEWASTPHRRLVHEYNPTPGYGGRWGLDFFEQFLASREGNASLPADIDDALTVLRVLDAVYDSAATDEWVDVASAAE